MMLLAEDSDNLENNLAELKQFPENETLTTYRIYLANNQSHDIKGDRYQIKKDGRLNIYIVMDYTEETEYTEEYNEDEPKETHYDIPVASFASGHWIYVVDLNYC